jgi:hypothetical protein
MQIPAELMAAIEAEPNANTMLTTLSAQSRYALAFRMHNLKMTLAGVSGWKPLSACSSADKRSTRKARRRVSTYSLDATSRRMAAGSRGLRTMSP